MTGGFRYWARPRTIRAPAVARTRCRSPRATTRTRVDVALYLALLARPGRRARRCVADRRVGATGPRAAGAIVPIIVLLVVARPARQGHLPRRAQRAVPAGADLLRLLPVRRHDRRREAADRRSSGSAPAFSKFGRHFANVIPPMVSNTPWMSSRRSSALHYRNFPDDLRPSERAVGLAHVGGTFVELVPPLVLLFSHNPTRHRGRRRGHDRLPRCSSSRRSRSRCRWSGTRCSSTSPRSCSSATRTTTASASATWTRCCSSLTVAGLLFFPVLGNLRPDLVSFLPSMRQYAGNWASAMWALAPGAEAKLDEHIVKRAPMQKDQLSGDLRRRGGRGRDAADARLARAAQPGPRPELGDDQPARRRHRRLHAARGRVRLQRDRRLQLRRRPPARPSG